ncbi:hypothetical protein F9L07_22690 [Pimelobacter simplex]|uniref:Uncharacterized protein n=1 Tax=Nocardioides simplex TaxID=2045 RepID=A0A7J5DT81_NOCSI|nr:hypothetical protein [Pimelobacter simplex]KAB2808326.1 hypothetical protein F9L07_22690 [Pimelobacter simplex]
MRLSELIAQDDRYDVDLNLEDGDIVTDLVALIRIQRLTDTDDALIIGATDTTGGIVQYGIVRSACLQVEQWMTTEHDDEP